MWSTQKILEVLDACCDAYTFPMLDNGYVFPAATRLSLHSGGDDWALVIELFGFSPRAGLPDTHVHTFGSRLRARDEPGKYVSEAAYESYLRANPHNESRFFRPLEEAAWQDEETSELVAEGATSVRVRGQEVAIPLASDLAAHGIELEEAPRIQTFELCRFLAATHRDAVLATSSERRVSVPSELAEIIVLDEWHHPDVVDDEERPSGSETFQQLAQVLVTGDAAAYSPTQAPNTHWSNWPDAGLL